MKQAADASLVTALDPTDSKQKIDAFLTPLFALKAEQAHSIDPAYAHLWQSINHLYQAGGKRLRSYMTLLTFSAYSSEPIESIIPSAAAQELIHLAMLIHDDIIDRDDIRYGIENISGSYLSTYAPHITDEVERRHYAKSAAILAGDLLISEAFILIAETQAPSSAIVSAQRLLAQAIFNVVGGELLDTEASFNTINPAKPLLIAQQKTASYSFVSPLIMGATLAGASLNERDKLKTLGEELGVAFQLRDDIIGIFGDSDVTGKSTDGDIREGKRTLLIEEFQNRATDEQRAQFNSLFGQHNLSDEGVETVRSLLIESGAKDAIEQIVQNYHAKSLAIVDHLEADGWAKTAFQTLITLCLKRDK